MKKVVSFLLAIVMMLSVFTGCNENYREEIQSLIDELTPKVESLSADADETYKNGVISEDLYTQIKALDMKFNENKDLFESSEKKKDSKILKALKECKESVDELQQQIDAVYEEYDEVRNYSFELVNDARILAESMTAGLANGYIDQTTMDEFNSIQARLEHITSNMFPDEAVKEELDTINERLAVMSSQCAAPNDVVDLFIDNAENTASVTETPDSQPEDNNENSSDSGIETLINNFTTLQNEASKNFEKGDISQEDYISLIELGTGLAELRDEIQKNGESEETNKKLQEQKKEIYDMAVKIGSTLAKNFE